MSQATARQASNPSNFTQRKIKPGEGCRAEMLAERIATVTHKMTRTICIRNIPDGLHCTLKAQAALAGMSLSAFVLAEIRHVAERPGIPELRERMSRRSHITAPMSAAEAVRRERDAF